jgi:hypothetical protein
MTLTPALLPAPVLRSHHWCRLRRRRQQPQRQKCRRCHRRRRRRLCRLLCQGSEPGIFQFILVYYLRLSGWLIEDCL